jgi:hypothetical protein
METISLEEQLELSQSKLNRVQGLAARHPFVGRVMSPLVKYRELIVTQDFEALEVAADLEALPQQRFSEEDEE